MGDNHHVYRRIRESLKQVYPQRLTGRQARHMNTLAGMISGIVRSGKSQMKAMAKKAPDKSKVESRIKRFTRYLQNEHVDAQTYFIPFIEVLLAGPLVLAIDGSEVGAIAWHWWSALFTVNVLCPWFGSLCRVGKGIFLKKHICNWCKPSSHLSLMATLSSSWVTASLTASNYKQKLQKMSENISFVQRAIVCFVMRATGLPSTSST